MAITKPISLKYTPIETVFWFSPVSDLHRGSQVGGVPKLSPRGGELGGLKGREEGGLGLNGAGGGVLE
jgi:hypothetical protein